MINHLANMGDYLYLLIAALFLPLFPLNILFHELFARFSSRLIRSLLLLFWPLPGLALVGQSPDLEPPAWLLSWALGSSILSAYRSLALRDVAIWISFLATSAWALLWVIPEGGMSFPYPSYLLAVAISLPLVLLTLLTGHIERQFGGAHIALKLQLAARTPRLAGLFVAAVLAVVAIPIFPTFFVLLKMIVENVVQVPAIAAVILLVWLLWSWSGARILQGIIVGGTAQSQAIDLNLIVTWSYALGLIGLAVAGLGLGGVLL